MRSIHFVVNVQMETMSHLGELKPNCWSRWTVAAIVKRVSLLWGLQILLGSSMTLSEDVLRRGSIFTCQTHRPELECSGWKSKVFQTHWLRMISWILLMRLTFTQDLISKQYQRKHCLCQLENARTLLNLNRLRMASGPHAPLVTLREQKWTCMRFQTEN